MWHPWRDLRRTPELVFEMCGDLPSGKAWWSPAHDVVLMRPGLLQVDRRCALAHELGHRKLGHSGCEPWYPDSTREQARMERNADGWAAHKLIELDALIAVGKWTGCRDEAAEELWVTRHFLDVRLLRMHPRDKNLLRTEGVCL